MAVTNTSASKVDTFIARLRHDYPDLAFIAGKQEHWSPKTNTITYNSNQSYKQLCYGLLHELAHALLEHSNYGSDFELLKLERDAWELAEELGRKYGVRIDPNHIQNCLDTYRNWLHRRSACPTCNTHVLQRDPEFYHCYNCQTIWKVTSGRFVRPYRKMLKTKRA
jgi:ribosomal protein L37AE/L43A